jgi:hypothetical protein
LPLQAVGFGGGAHVDTSAHGAGKPPRRLRRHPSQEGNLRGQPPPPAGGTPFSGRGLFLVWTGTSRTARETTPPPTAAPLPGGEFTGATPAACGRHPLLRKGAILVWTRVAGLRGVRRGLRGVRRGLRGVAGLLGVRRGLRGTRPTPAPFRRRGCLRRGGGCTRAVRGVPNSPLGRGGAKRRGGLPAPCAAHPPSPQPPSNPPKPPSFVGGAPAGAGGVASLVQTFVSDI